MRSKTMIVILVYTIMSGLACQEEDVYNGPLLGVWEEIVDLTNLDDPKYVGNCDQPDGGFSGTFQFKENGEFRFDGGFVSFGGYTGAFLEGTFTLQSDTVLVLNSTDYDDDHVFQDLDTLYISFLSSTLFVHNFVHHRCLTYWERKD